MKYREGGCWLYGQQGFEGELGDRRLVVRAETSRTIDGGTFETDRMFFIVEDNEFEIDHLGLKVLFNLDGVPGGSRRTDASLLEQLSDNPTISFKVLMVPDDSQSVTYRFDNGPIPTLAEGESVLDTPLAGHQIFLGIRWEGFNRAMRSFVGGTIGINLFLVAFDFSLPEL